MAKETTQTTARVRVSRKPLSRRGPQAISGDKDPNYEYRFVNDTGSRIHNFLAAGYEFVEDDTLAVGDSRVSDASDLGSRKRVISNDGTAAYLMRIPKEYYEEDQAAKQKELADQEQAIQQEGSQKGMYGQVKLGRDK